MREEVPDRCLAGEDVGRDVLKEPAVVAEYGIEMTVPVERPPELRIVPDELGDKILEVIAREKCRLFAFTDLNFWMFVQQRRQIGGPTLRGTNDEEIRQPELFDHIFICDKLSRAHTAMCIGPVSGPMKMSAVAMSSGNVVWPPEVKVTADGPGRG